MYALCMPTSVVFKFKTPANMAPKASIGPYAQIGHTSNFISFFSVFGSDGKATIETARSDARSLCQPDESITAATITAATTTNTTTASNTTTSTTTSTTTIAGRSAGDSDGEPICDLGETVCCFIRDALAKAEQGLNETEALDAAFHDSCLKHKLQSAVRYFIIGVTILVVAVPEGLPLGK